MNQINCIIVEDEVPASEELKFILSDYEFLNIIDTAYDGETAVNIIKKKHPRAVFLDINMPAKNGIDVAKEVKLFDSNIEIIFITAYEQHALKAFEINALDYMLKPFDEKRINLTINRLKNKLLVNTQTELPRVVNKIIDKLNTQEKNLNKVPCEYQGKIILVSLEDIFFCYTENEKVFVKTFDKSYFINYTMNKLEEKTNFFRAHRGYIVNLDNIKELYSWFNGTYKLVMNDKENSEIPISRNHVKNLKEILGL